MTVEEWERATAAYPVRLTLPSPALELAQDFRVSRDVQAELQQSPRDEQVLDRAWRDQWCVAHQGSNRVMSRHLQAPAQQRDQASEEDPADLGRRMGRR